MCHPSSRLDQLLSNPVPLETAVKYSWSNEDRSLNIFVKEDDPLTIHRHPVAQSTDCIRGKVGFARGIHAWEITWNSRQRGTHAVIGVATSDSPLHCNGYSCLIGATDTSWGWDITRNKVIHDSKNFQPAAYPIQANGEDGQFVTPDTFTCVLDMDEGTLSFIADDKFQGIAFKGLKGKVLYPIVSAVWGHCEVTMRYINGLDREYL